MYHQRPVGFEFVFQQFAAVHGLEQPIGVGELAHTLGIPHVGDFQPLESGLRKLFDEPEFGPGGNGPLFVLETVSYRDLTRDNLWRIFIAAMSYSLLPVVTTVKNGRIPKSEIQFPKRLVS
jgi:hypothetical protein